MFVVCFDELGGEPVEEKKLRLHLDDKWQVIEKVLNNRALGVYMCQKGWGNWDSVSTVADYLDLVDRKCVPREFPRPFFEPP